MKDYNEYVVRILPGEGCNPEFAPDRKSQEGIKCNGFLLATFRDGRVQTEAICGISGEDMQHWLEKRRNQVAQVVMQAAIIARAYQEAAKIYRHSELAREMDIGQLVADDGEDE